MLIWGSGVVSAQTNPQLQFDRANSQLQAGQFREALSIYQSLEKQGHISGSLFLNMAIGYVQLDSLGKAKYYFMKAEEFEETRNRAGEGLEFVESRFSHQSAVLPKLPWELFFDWLGNTMGATPLLAIGIILVNVGITAFVAGWFFTTIAKSLRIGGMGAGAAGLIIVFSSFYIQYLQNRYSQAVMIHQQANVVEQPGSDGAIVSQAYEGYTFTVDHSKSGEYSGWSYVRLSNGLYGWIPNTEIMIL